MNKSSIPILVVMNGGRLHSEVLLIELHCTEEHQYFDFRTVPLATMYGSIMKECKFKKLGKTGI